MKKFWRILMAVACILLVVGTTTGFAATKQEKIETKRNEIRVKAFEALDKLYDRRPGAKAAIKQSAGYAVFVNTGFKAIFLGGAHGRGLAVNNATGEEVFMRMQEVETGIGLGVKEYALIFAFANRDSLYSFVKKGWNFNANAEAVADDGVNGGAYEGAVQVSPGVWVYQISTKGLSLNLAVKGTRYFLDKELN